MRRFAIFGAVLAAVLFSFCKDNSSGPETPELPPGSDIEGWKLVWYDEFDHEGLPDSTRWGYEPFPPGTVNEELQNYTYEREENARVVGGILIIEARRDFYENHEYSSARLVTKTKGDWTYGRFEIRAKLPTGRGTWPAIWMMPTNNYYGNGSWPDNGEIDIMEHVGYNPGVIHGSIHCDAYNWPAGTQKTATRNITDAQTAYHTYAMEWGPDTLAMFVDSTRYFTFVNEDTGWEAWPFDKNFFIILNVAIGGSWGGQQGVDNTIFPTRMQVEYVRVYEKEE